jgi:hypothetical protein
VRGLLVSLATIVLVGLSVLLAEGLARLVLPDDGGALMSRYYENAFDYLVPRVKAKRLGPPGAPRPSGGPPRIAIVGESSAEFLGNELERIEAACPGTFVAVNAGRGGSALEHVAADFDDVAARHPDVVLFLFGHNLELVYPTDRGAVLRGVWQARSRLLRFLTTAPRDELPVATPAARLAAYEAFLRHAAGSARERGFQLVVHTMTPNMWLAPTPPSDPHDPALLEARWLLTRGDPAGAAAAALDSARARTTAEAWYEAGSFLALAGDTPAARVALERAIVEDPVLGRARAWPETNALVRRIAREERLVLRDTEQLLSERTVDGLPGWEWLGDACHLRVVERHHEALALLAQFAPAAVECARAHPPVTGDETLWATVAYREELESQAGPERTAIATRAISDVFLRIARAGTDGARERLEVSATGSAAAAPPRVVELMSAAIADGVLRAGDRALAERLLAPALVTAGFATTHVVNGLLKATAHDDTAAAAAFDAALARDPADVAARYYRSRLP